MDLTTSLCLVAYCPQHHANVIALIRDAKLAESFGAKLRKFICKTCLKSFEMLECDLKKEHVLDEELDRCYGKDSLPTLP